MRLYMHGTLYVERSDSTGELFISEIIAGADRSEERRLRLSTAMAEDLAEQLIQQAALLRRAAQERRLA